MLQNFQKNHFIVYLFFFKKKIFLADFKENNFVFFVAVLRPTSIFLFLENLGCISKFKSIHLIIHKVLGG